jgi:hypothetical protein
MATPLGISLSHLSLLRRQLLHATHLYGDRRRKRRPADAPCSGHLKGSRVPYTGMHGTFSAAPVGEPVQPGHVSDRGGATDEK